MFTDEDLTHITFFLLKLAFMASASVLEKQGLTTVRRMCAKGQRPFGINSTNLHARVGVSLCAII